MCVDCRRERGDNGCVHLMYDVVTSICDASRNVIQADLSSDIITASSTSQTTEIIWKAL